MTHMFILTFKNTLIWEFLGLFPEYTGAKKELNTHLKEIKQRDKENDIRTRAKYVIHTVSNTSQTIKPYDCVGDYRTYQYNHKTGELVSNYDYVKHTFNAFSPLEKKYEKEELLEKIAKKCGGLVTGGGTNFVFYDWSVEIPFHRKEDFIRHMKENKFRHKYMGKTTPYE